MRVLFAVNPATSIFNSMVPLAWALRTAGHDVRVASQHYFGEVITAAGLTAVPVGRNSDFLRAMTAKGISGEVMEEARAGLPAPFDIVDNPDLTWEETRDAHGSDIERYKLEGFAMLAGTVEFARAWQPDLVVWEPFTPAGAIAAKACGAAHARVVWSVDVFGITRERFLGKRNAQPVAEREDPLGDWLGGYARRYGGEFTEDMAVGHFTIDPVPAPLGMRAADPHYLPMRYIAYNGPAVVPGWLQKPAARPRVAITLGVTAIDHFAGYTVSIQDILDSLSDLDIEVVATIDEEEQAKLKRIPDNARLLPYVPLNALAATCSAVVNHAGPGTLLTSALHGVPQLTLPFHFDEPLLAGKLAEQGAGLTIDPTATSGQNIRENLLRLLEEPSFTERAVALREDIAAMPAPNELVGEIERLTVKYRTRQPV
ncbi:activator-dependent family glycosyltransferase [Amycolatopsis suaedae]|uniref:Activator-dependent family glycosyltransferase n=1 Tax=Amycolatopsis suaedae TaxID=2510978 RepID=A0A4Q7J314_9PSEU|nr:activator-dependent family glycosyltransferase [Amycolatopsis suaedae]RZQ61168.1 activator-dependent family glycosyltransferase [Amycolatopsis suaedae]